MEDANRRLKFLSLVRIAKRRLSPSGVKRVVVIVDVVEAQAGLSTTPSPLGASVKVPTPAAVGARKPVVCASGPVEVETLRRTDHFSRLDMPNEDPETLILAPK